MPITNHYKSLLEKAGKNLNEILGNYESKKGLTICHNYIDDFDALNRAIRGRPEQEVFYLAIKEYHFALFALTSGQYRHAFVGLRLFFELMLAAISFSANEFDYRMWLKGRKDINWCALIDSDKGVLSKNFIFAFNSEFSEHAAEHLAIASKIYRELSEFVHGNANSHESIPPNFSFDSEIHKTWIKKASSVRDVILYCYSARYLDFLDKADLKNLEPLLIDAIGHLPAIQFIYNKQEQI